MLTNGDVWTPLTIDPGKEIRLNHTTFVVARLRPGVPFDQAQAEMNTIAARVAAQYPEMKDWGVRLVTFYNTFVSTQRQTALLVLAAVGCVLLIACANIANLLLASAAARQKDIAIRTVLGVSRGTLLRQLLAESLMLSCDGGARGVLLAI